MMKNSSNQLTWSRLKYRPSSKFWPFLNGLWFSDTSATRDDDDWSDSSTLTSFFVKWLNFGVILISDWSNLILSKLGLFLEFFILMSSLDLKRNWTFQYNFTNFLMQPYQSVTNGLMSFFVASSLEIDRVFIPKNNLIFSINFHKT